MIPAARRNNAPRTQQTLALITGIGAREMILPPRQVLEIEVEMTSTSCGYGVPVMEFVRERRTIDRGRRYEK